MRSATLIKKKKKKIFLKVDSQMMCQLQMRSTILKNVSLSYKIMTHHLRIVFLNKNLESAGTVW
jgi:hypothetical protein